jgi:molybdopterin-containing oxidoreductase family iron-sulfur binding subunit
MSRRKPYEFQAPAKTGPKMWRSLEDKDADPAELKRLAESELPGGFVGSDALLQKSGVSRRDFLAVTGVTGAALALEGCVRRPVENIMPYSEGPEYSLPGIPLHFATVTQRGGDALGLLVTSHENRPTKIEGNPSHPSSGGATDVRAQAFIMDLYDPDRAKVPSTRKENGREASTMEAFDSALGEIAAAHAEDRGAGLRFLIKPTNSPSVRRLRQAVASSLPEARFFTYESVNDANVREGARAAFGTAVASVVQYENARVIVSADSDFLGLEPGAVRASRGFARSRRIESPRAEMNRLYVVEANYSITGATADHRLRVPASRVGGYLKALAAVLADRGVDLGAVRGTLGDASAAGVPAEWLSAVAADLVANRGRSVVVVGRNQPAWVHALGHAINTALGNIGPVVRLYPLMDPEQGSEVADIKALVQGIGDAKTLVILDGNPVYDAPADLGFGSIFEREGLTTVVLSSHVNETAELATWHCPLAHELESWGDQRAVDGTVSIQQPLIAPLYHARSPIEVLARFAGERNWRGHGVVRRTLRDLLPAQSLFEASWRRILHAGLIEGSAAAPLSGLRADAARVAQAVTSAPAAPELSPQALEVQFFADAALHDGQHANNPWALELPDPMTKISWDNAALMSRTTQRELGLVNGDIVRLKAGDATVEMACWALPGHADNSVSVQLGWGRAQAGHYGNGRGFDVHPLRTSDGFFIRTGVAAESTGRRYNVVQTQTHGRMENRPLANEATLEEYRENPEFAQFETVQMVHTPPLWKEVDYSPREVATGRVLHKWGMAIDLSACTGCNACVVACQAENNIPAVGKREVERGREMYWIRIDRYFLGEDVDSPATALQPVACQHCEEAPCENVCPVNATAHSPEGLNDMAYNRCIGTRYCANNCPYKVRRFNYLDWHSHLEELEDLETGDRIPYRVYGQFPQTPKMQFNPNVTVRMRGVMEKCTYCVQRIQQAKIESRRNGRTVGGDDVVTACAQACPTEAIVFGDLNQDSRVARLARLDRHYALLAELGTQPRTTFLAKIRNPNPAMGGAQAQSDTAAQEAHG